jgi:hypothetical protein
MSDLHKHILLILDDREFAGEEVRTLVGTRRYGDIIYKRRAVVEHFRAALPEWARGRLIHLRGADELPAVRAALEASGEDVALCVIAGRAGFVEPARLFQLIERLPYADEDFTDRLYNPLLVFQRNAHTLVGQWPAFEAAPMHLWDKSWQGSQRLQSVAPLDLSRIRDFLAFISGSTATRHFNEVAIDAYYYTKRSTDKRKMRAEYGFYGLVPESLRPWLIQPFEFQEEAERASYKMMRYYLADAALQWVHDAFDDDTFVPFVERLMFFLSARPTRACTREQSAALARDLFVTKVESRVNMFLASDDGRRINAVATSATPHLDIGRQLARYLKLYARHEKAFAFDHMAVGHGDPCFSNVLYDQQRYLLKLIDPKGAITEDELWTHPLYDLCKISHSALGDYDFINNGLYEVGFTDQNDLVLRLRHGKHAMLKSRFRETVKKAGYSERIMRLGEASLFLSMLPLHVDYPNKVLAFLLKANQILDEVESE